MPTDLLSCLIAVAILAPPDCRLDDRARFPPQSVAATNLHFAREHCCWLESNPPLEIHRLEDWRGACKEARWRYECWDWLNAAQGGEGRGSDYWLYSLRRVRELIGEEAYANGIMPSPIP